MVSPSGPVSIERFTVVIADYFELDPAEVTPAATLVDDLEFDSIMFLEIAMLLEDLADRQVSAEDPEP